MSNLPSLSGPVSLKGPGAKILPFHKDLAGEVHKAQKADLKKRRESNQHESKSYENINEELMQFLHSAMREATTFKQNCGVTARLHKNLDLLEGRYDAREIRLMGGRETAVWFNLTERISRTFIAFLRKTLAGVEVDFPQYDLKPTRVPDPPPEMLERATGAVIEFIELMIASGQELTEDEIENILQEVSDTLFTNVQDELNKSIRRAKRELDDILQKLNWAKIIDELIHDLVHHGTAIVYGPFPEITKRQYYSGDKIKTRHEKCIGARRLDPMRVYPSPDSQDTQKGSYIIIHDTMTRAQLNEARSLGAGWIDEALCTILEEFANQSRYWCANRYFHTEESANHDLDGIGGMQMNHMTSSTKNTPWADFEDIDVIKYYGKVPAKLLLKHGINNFDGRKIDEKQSLEVCIYWVNDTIVKVNCNIDPKCERPIHRAKLFNSPGRFWGKGVPETIEPQQRLANAALRSIVRNMGLSSAPIFEWDKALTRPSGKNKQISDIIHPGMTIEKNSQITGLTGQALQVHQIDSRVQEYMSIINQMMELAEHVVGVPRFLTGAANVGGAASTYSGLQTLSENAAIQIRSSIINLDFDLIKPFTNMAHRWMIIDRDDPLLYSDVEVITQGASALLAREVNKDRLTALIGLLMPFAQADIVTPQGITYILAELIQDHGLDPSLILRDNLELSRFSDIYNRNLNQASNFVGGQAAAAAPDGTISQAGVGAPILDPQAQLLAQGQTAVAPIIPGGVGGQFVNPVGVAA